MLICIIVGFEVINSYSSYMNQIDYCKVADPSYHYYNYYDCYYSHINVVHWMNEGYRAWGALKSVMNNRGLWIKAKKCLYEGVSVPTALYVRSRGMGYEKCWEKESENKYFTFKVLNESHKFLSSKSNASFHLSDLYLVS